MELQGCKRHRWVKPRGRKERERVSQSVRWRRRRKKRIAECGMRNAGESNIHLKSLSNSLCVPIHAHSIVSPVRLPTVRMSRLTLTDQ